MRAPALNFTARPRSTGDRRHSLARAVRMPRPRLAVRGGGAGEHGPPRGVAVTRVAAVLAVCAAGSSLEETRRTFFECALGAPTHAISEPDCPGLDVPLAVLAVDAGAGRPPLLEDLRAIVVGVLAAHRSSPAIFGASERQDLGPAGARHRDVAGQARLHARPSRGRDEGRPQRLWTVDVVHLRDASFSLAGRVLAVRILTGAASAGLGVPTPVTPARPRLRASASAAGSEYRC